MDAYVKEWGRKVLSNTQVASTRVPFAAIMCFLCKTFSHNSVKYRLLGLCPQTIIVCLRHWHFLGISAFTFHYVCVMRWLFVILKYHSIGDSCMYKIYTSDIRKTILWYLELVTVDDETGYLIRCTPVAWLTTIGWSDESQLLEC